VGVQRDLFVKVH